MNTPLHLSSVRRGSVGAVAAAHPLAVSAGEQMLREGGSAADAAIAAQAMLCVIMPDACGLGGDMLALVHQADGALLAINGTGVAPAGLADARAQPAGSEGANSITVPGIVAAWSGLSQRCGRLALASVLRPAIALARQGIAVSSTLARALTTQRARLLRGGATPWVLFDQPAGVVHPQLALATLLERIGADGCDAFYRGSAATAIVRAVRDLGGALGLEDLATHATVVATPVESRWGKWRIATQPPMSQGILLNLAIEALKQLPEVPAGLADHVGIELTTAAFASRDEVALGEALLSRPLPIDMTRAARRAGPRAYLHTAGVATADAAGNVVSSLVSVFDDFGSCVFVPELGIVLNDRAAGFTSGLNAAAPGKRPVHTLAPLLLITPEGVLALATPGADGQVQTLLQVLMSLQRAPLRDSGTCLQELAHAIAAPRWRSENGRLLVEQSHSGRDALASLGHELVRLHDGDTRFGAVVCAGQLEGGLLAIADWRRETAAGAV